MLPPISLIQIVILCFATHIFASARNVGSSRFLERAAQTIAHEANQLNVPDLKLFRRAGFRGRRLSTKPQRSSLPVLDHNDVSERSLSTLSRILLPTNPAARVSTSPVYPVECFERRIPKLSPTMADDCQVIIDHVILRYPNPMMPQTFGYSDSVDIDLRKPENQRWIFGQCSIFVRGLDQTLDDTFRMVDVASTASRITKTCVTEVKYPNGGAAGIGSTEENYYVAVGGAPVAHMSNETVLSLPSGK